jgi:alpha-beta hydrolase superfamily lysophospholipase
MSTSRTPVVFVHGLWLHSSSWQNWVEAFNAAGYEAITPEWPGVADTVAEARGHPERQAGKGLNEIVDHFAAIIAGLDAKPIVIGHSFGGLISQRLLGQDAAIAAVAIDPAQIKGVLPLPLAQLRSAFPALSNPLNFKRSVSLTQKQFRYGFGNALTEQESNELWERWTIPSPARPLFEAASANFAPKSPAKVNVRNNERGPLLLISGKADHTVPDVVTRAAYKLYRHSTAVTELKQFEGRGHSLALDHGWKDVADASLTFLQSHGV